MTLDHEFHRRLAAFLDEGPVRSPDRPVEAAVAHAVAHPRRRDPFAVLRRDPMAPTARPFGRQLFAVAAIGLLVALAAAAYVGSQPRPPSVLPPSPTAGPTAVPSDPGPRTFSVVITDANGLSKTVRVFDASGRLGGALPWPADPDRIQSGEIEVSQRPQAGGTDPRSLVVQWVDLSCPDDYRLTIDGDATRIELGGASCPADAIGVDHGLRLDFTIPVDATQVTAVLVR